MTNLIDQFEAVYLINLPERTDRLRRAQTEFAKLHWEHGQTGVRVFPALRFEDRDTFPSAAVRGCFHSHFECLSDALQRGDGDVLIMEDDIALSSVLREITPSIVQAMKSQTWELLYFGHDDTGDIPLLTPREKQVSFLPYSGAIRGAHFYAVNRRILDRLVQHLSIAMSGREGDQEFGPMPIDGAFNIFRWTNPDVQTLISVPKMGWQRASRSDITPRAFDRYKVLRPIIRAIRNIKSAKMGS